VAELGDDLSELDRSGFQRPHYLVKLLRDYEEESRALTKLAFDVGLEERRAALLKESNDDRRSSY
jgi:hypothetical protein